nr:MATE family efflux transporter [Prevotella sp.]
MKDNRDSIDFAKDNITKLYNKILFPTLLGMLFMASYTVCDGIIVGLGVGSDALAAVNIAAPLFMVGTGVSLMFGAGSSVVAAIHLSKGKNKAANINITQATFIPIIFMIIISTIVMSFCKETAYLLGSSEKLMPLVVDYLHWYIPFLSFFVPSCVGMFIIRLDGSPRYAMMCNIIPALVNIILDLIFVFPLGYGIKGAAFASSAGMIVSTVMVIIYMTRYNKILHFYRLKISRKSAMLTCRNLGYMVKVGFSALFGELAISCMMIVGNYRFIEILGEDGVAAFSVVCYCLPLVFMFNTALTQSAQPIISFNHGAKLFQRERKAFLLSLYYGVLTSIILSIIFFLGSKYIVAAFLSTQCNAYNIAVKGLSLFATGFVFFAMNITFIGYFQSIEKAIPATVFTLIRGIVAMTLCFIFLPYLIGSNGLWFAVPTSELITFIMIIIYYLKKGRE